MEKICYKDLSSPLKVMVILCWILIVANAISFIYGYMWALNNMV